MRPVGAGERSLLVAGALPEVVEDQFARLFEKLARVAGAYLDVVLRHAGDIPEDRQLRKAVQEQRAVVDAYLSSPAAAAFQSLAHSVSRLPAPKGANGAIEFFLEQLVATGPARQEQVA